MKMTRYAKKMFYMLVGFVCLGTLFLDVANATIYYVATNGNDSNPGTSAQPFRTIKEGMMALSAGDTLYVKSGTYSESIDTWRVPFANGTSWNNPITVAVNPGDTVTIHPNTNSSFIWVADGQRKYLIVKGFVVDGRHTANHGFKFESGSKYVRVTDSEIKNAKFSGILVTGVSDPSSDKNNSFHEFINLNLHHNGINFFDHGIYIATSHNLIDQSEIHHNASYGGHIYKSSTNTANNNVVRNSSFHDNNTSGQWGCGLLLSSGNQNVAYNNVAYGNFAGFCTLNRTSNAHMYNNIAYENDNYGIYVGKNTNNGSRIENNTLYNNGVYGVFVGDGAINANVRNNISRSHSINFGLTGSSSSNNLTANPLFVNAGGKNFHLQSGSPAIDTGLTISGIGTDFDGISRPQGSNFDIGAYEFQGGSGGGGSGGGGSGGGGGGTYPPTMNSPAPGSTITTSSVTFTGGHTGQDEGHWLSVGTSVGGENIYNQSMGSGHTATVSGLPSSGTLHVRYWTFSNSSGWVSQDHTYTMSVGGGSGGGGGGGGGSFPPAMSTPSPGSTLTSRSITFTGGHTSQDLEHWLEIGTSVGAANLFQSGTMGTAHTRNVSGLPTSGTIYVRWWTRRSSGWDKQDHTYTMNVGGGGGGGGGGSFPPAMSTPSPGSTLTSRSITFTGGHTSQDLEHWLEIGTSVGAANLFQSGTMGTAHTRNVSGLPTSGTIYVRWWTRRSSGWDKQDHTYTMNVGGG